MRARPTVDPVSLTTMPTMIRLHGDRHSSLSQTNTSTQAPNGAPSPFFRYPEEHEQSGTRMIRVCHTGTLVISLRVRRFPPARLTGGDRPGEFLHLGHE
jgi:hypothetical protein